MIKKALLAVTRYIIDTDDLPIDSVQVEFSKKEDRLYTTVVIGTKEYKWSIEADRIEATRGTIIDVEARSALRKIREDVHNAESGGHSGAEEVLPEGGDSGGSSD